jgi:phosphatidylglycerophosphate synthase
MSELLREIETLQPAESDREQEPLLSLPNLLTLVRLPLAVLVWFVAHWPAALIGVMVTAGLSDVLDGWFARRMRALRVKQGLPTRRLGEKGGRGAWLDPVCDKAFVLSALGAVLVFYLPPWWWLPLIAAREVLQLPLIAAYKLVPGMVARLRFDFRAGPPGKLATIAQFLAVWAFVLEHEWWFGLALVAGLIGVLATLDYVRRALVHAHGG